MVSDVACGMSAGPHLRLPAGFCFLSGLACKSARDCGEKRIPPALFVKIDSIRQTEPAPSWRPGVETGAYPAQPGTSAAEEIIDRAAHYWILASCLAKVVAGGHSRS